MADFHLGNLRCEYLENPLGIDERTPRLSWRMVTERRGARQTAYRIRVASTPELLEHGGGDLWDSGRVDSDQSALVPYAGRPLASRQQAWWHVEVTDEAGETLRSEPAHWSMGLLEKSDWRARWVAADAALYQRDKEAIAPTLLEPGTPVLFRKQFVAGQPGEQVRRATLYASARGLVELRLNGKPVTRDLFVPEWTDYDKRIQYRTFDVTALLKREGSGTNILDATLGDGWWSGYVGWQETRARYGSLENSLLVQLEVELADGRTLTVATDASWTTSTGPILSSDFMMGEIYDARREVRVEAGPSAGGSWLTAREVESPNVPLVAQRSQPVRINQTLKPVSMNEVTPGTFIYDLGQNITGWVRLKVPAGLPPGTKVQLRHGERLNPDGTLYTENLRRAKATDVYIADGGPAREWEPHFTFHGFQYVELTGLPAGTRPGIEAVTGCAMYSATPLAGQFECSNKDVNRLWLNGLWSQRDNFLTVPTDCPQRDERLGWMGDAQVFLRTASYNMDVAAFFTKWMIDVEDAQTPDGIFPDTAPRLREGENFVGLGNLGGSAGWADAGVIVPYTIWRVYGDRRIIARHWGAMVKWLDWVERHNPNGLRLNELANNYGDWLCIPSDTSFGTHSPMKNLLATAYWANDALMMARIAKELGLEQDAARFAKMYEHVRAAFQKEWMLPDGELKVDTQTAYLLGLAFELFPEHVRERAAERLVENIRKLDWHLSTGFIGISHLNPQLTLSGHADVAYRLLLQDTYPSWLYPVKHGATTIWERWNGWTHQDGFFNPQMNSFNHYSLGSVGEWLFRHMAGIELDPEVAGFKRFVLRPYLPGPDTGLTFAKASYETQHGTIVSHWQRKGAEVQWEVEVPANTTARAYIPCDSDVTIRESGQPVEKAAAVRVLGRQGRALVCDLAAGRYRFETRYAD